MDLHLKQLTQKLAPINTKVMETLRENNLTWFPNGSIQINHQRMVMAFNQPLAAVKPHPKSSQSVRNWTGMFSGHQSLIGDLN